MSWFAQNRVRNRHLADVVEECSASHDREVARGNWSCLGDGNCEGRDALAMAVGFHIFKFKSAAESFDGVVISLCEGCGQFLGSFSQLVHDCAFQASFDIYEVDPDGSVEMAGQCPVLQRRAF